MNSYKNIISWFIKILIGFASFYFIYVRLKSEFSPDKISTVLGAFSVSNSYFLLLFALIFVPINWGIESYKWQLITAPVESLNFITASKSVYTGLCIGNLAPGRATEFLGKIVFFKSSNRGTITLLHFANGMFQLAVTILFGLMAVFVFYQEKINSESVNAFFIGGLSILLLSTFIAFVTKFDAIQKWLIKKFERSFGKNSVGYHFNRSLIGKLLSFSLLRYTVFIFQFILLLKLFYAAPISSQIIAGIAIYFLLTTILPMISFIEVAVRSAIVLLVFSGSGISEIALVVTAIILWILNVVLPSIIGYVIIVREKFDLSLFKRN